jgi:hypothetical protein
MKDSSKVRLKGRGKPKKTIGQTTKKDLELNDLSLAL